MEDFKVLKQNAQNDTHEFLVDTPDTLEQLPKETGSVCLVANTGKVYICNNAKEWVEI